MNGGLIRRRLIELGKSREELAAEIGCSATTINNALGGKRLGDKNLYRVAKALGLTIDELLNTQDSSKRKPA